MEKYVEFYFPGVSVSGSCERKVKNEDISAITNIPKYALFFRFFDQSDDGSKLNFSKRYWLGKKFSIEELKIKYPQVSISQFVGCQNVVKSSTGGFYPLEDLDAVI